VFVRADDGALEFLELPEPSPQQVEEVAARTAKRIAHLLEEAGKSLDPELADAFEDDFALCQPVLASCYGAASRGADLSGDRAGQRTLRLFQQDEVKKTEPAAVVAGVNVHAGVAFDGKDKPRLERLCRYLARPPIAQDRLALRDDGAVQYTMKKAWKDGTRAIVLQPLDLIARVCAMIPSPRFNMIRFHGVFSPNAKLRSEVVPSRESRCLADESPAELTDAEQTNLFGEEKTKPKRNPWAWLIKKVFLVDVMDCPECGGRMKWLDACTEERDINRVLAAHGLAPRAPPLSLWSSFDQLSFSF